MTATVEGHTGNLQATPEQAMKISQQRAQNVVNYLVDNFGIARSRLDGRRLWPNATVLLQPAGQPSGERDHRISEIDQGPGATPIAAWPLPLQSRKFLTIGLDNSFTASTLASP